MKKIIIQAALLFCLVTAVHASEVVPAWKSAATELNIAAGKHGRIVRYDGRTCRSGKRYYRMLNVAVPSRAGEFYLFLELRENGAPRIELNLRKDKKILQKFEFPSSKKWQWVRLGPLKAGSLFPDFDICAGSSPKCQIFLSRAVLTGNPQWKSTDGTAASLKLPGIAVGYGSKGIPAGPFLLIQEKRFATDQTTVSFHRDEKALYADFTAFDRTLDPRANQLHLFKSKEKNPWRNDFTILLLERDGVMYDFLITGGGRLSEARMTGPDYWEKRNTPQRSGASASVKIGDGVWHSSLRIPWSAVGGPPRPGERFRFQAGRRCSASGERSTLFPTTNGYHELQNFGNMYFASGELPGTAVKLPEFLPGENQITLPRGVNSEVFVAFQDKFPEFYRGRNFRLNHTGRFVFQWNMSDPATGCPWFVSPQYTFAISACRLKFSASQSIGLNGVQVKSGTIMKSGLNKIRLPENFTGKLSAGEFEIVPPAGEFTLAVDSSMIWPNWHEKELAIPAGALQMLMFAPRGFPGRITRDYTLKLDLPPGFKVECASGYYSNYKISWTEDGRISFHTPLKYSDLPPMHRFISVFIRAPQKAEKTVAEIAYSSSSASEKIVEVPRKFKVRLLPHFSGVRPKHFRIYVWSGISRRLTENAFLQKMVKELAGYGINEVNGIPGAHLSFTGNFNLYPYSWTPIPYIKKHPERALIKKDGSRDLTLLCPQYIRTPEFGRWVDTQMPAWLAKIGNPPVAEWDYEYRYNDGPFSCYCAKCSKEADVASRNRMTAYYARLMRDAMKRCKPDIKFVMYSGYQSEETKRHYGIDWSLFPGILDMVECGYGRSVKTLRDTYKAIGNTPLVTGAIIRPYSPSSRAALMPYTPALLLRRALDATGGILLYEYSMFEGNSLRAIAAVSRIIARYEDFFRFGKRRDITVNGWNADEVQIIEYRGKSVLFLMNSGKMPKKYEKNVVAPGEVAVLELPGAAAKGKP